MSTPRGAVGRRALAAVVAAAHAALAALAGRASAQDSIAPPTAVRRVDGRVVVQRDTAPVPLAGAWVTLHRVAGEASGPLDSVRTDARGAYGFTYRAVATGESIYFVSTRYGGVAYFTRPLRAGRVSGQDAQIDVFDTTSASVRTTIRGRHLIVSAPEPNGARTVVEVFELSNDTSVTALERSGSPSGVWSTRIPAAAHDFEVRDGEIPADALSAVNGRVALHMPLSPGLRQIAFSYSLAEDAFPLAITTDAPAAVMEVLVEDPRASAAGGKLVAVTPVNVEGRAFRRFLAQDVPASTQVVVDVTRATPPWMRWVVPAILGLMGLAMLAVLARAARRVAPIAGLAPRPVAAAPRDPADAIAREIAALDDAFEARGEPANGERETYVRERDVLKARLAAALAARADAR